MAKTNIVILSGNITRDPEISMVGENLKRAKFTLANNIKKANGENITDYFDCVAFRQTADLIEKYIKKGDGVTVSGRLSTSTTTLADGTNRKFVNILVNEVEFHPRKTETNPSEEVNEELPF